MNRTAPSNSAETSPLLIRSAAWLAALILLFGGTRSVFQLIERHYRKQLVEFFSYTRGPLVRGENLRIGLPLVRGVVVRLGLLPDRDRLAGVSIQTVTWGNGRGSFACKWELRENDVILRSGTVSSGRTKDWAFLPITFGEVPDSGKRNFTLVMTAGEDPESGFVGIPLFEKGSTPVEVSLPAGSSPIGATEVPPGLSTCAQLLYAKGAVR